MLRVDLLLGVLHSVAVWAWVGIGALTPGDWIIVVWIGRVACVASWEGSWFSSGPTGVVGMLGCINGSIGACCPVGWGLGCSSSFCSSLGLPVALLDDLGGPKSLVISVVEGPLALSI